MKYCLLVASFFILGCQAIDPVVVPIDTTARAINKSSTVYDNNTTHIDIESSGVVWRKEF